MVYEFILRESLMLLDLRNAKYSQLPFFQYFRHHRHDASLLNEVDAILMVE